LTNSMRALVTGGAGFLGSHLSERLLEEGCEVICVDNLKTARKENLADLQSRRGFTFLHRDITEPVFIDGPIDFVLHFASPASPTDYHRHPIHTLKVGALGTYHALGLAKAKTAKFLLASTSEVYGDPLVNPQPESYWGNVNPIGPRGVYDEAKRYAEALAMAYHRAHNVDVRIVRIFNTYGPRMRTDDGRALPNFMAQSLRGEPITIQGDGRQTRSFCYVSDLVEGVLRLLRVGEKNAPVVNLGNPEEITILDFARQVIQVTGSNSELVFRPLPEDDPTVRRPDITKAQQLLGWNPQVSLREGLQKVLPYFEQAVGAAREPGKHGVTEKTKI
jgi:dTDP-glucose 4,6-dehydratase